MSIHRTAQIDPTATVHDTAQIDPYVIVGPDTTIGKDAHLMSHAIIQGHTTLGDGCVIHPTAVIGGDPQDLNFQSEETTVMLGNRVVVREGVTINRATGAGNATVVGDDCLIMAYAHLAHNCQLGNRVILANGAQLGGYVTVGDSAFISAMSVVHQHVRIGRFVMMGGRSGTRQDLPPFALCNGWPARVMGLNRVGLKRGGFNPEARNVLKRAYQILWFSNQPMPQALAQLKSEFNQQPLTDELIQFVETSKRGIHLPSSGGDSYPLEDKADLEDADAIMVV